MSPQTITLPDGVRLCVETFGDPADPAVVLAHGASASMLWWEAELCQRLADAGRFVVRYDQRDTGRSTIYPVGEPGYGQTELAHDVLAIMDHLGTGQAHPDRPDDLSTREAQVAYVLDETRAYDGVSPYYDDETARTIIEADVDRSRNFVAALTNPFLIELSEPRHGGFADLTQPTLVLHGELDPVLPLAHGEAIARAVPGARLVVFEGQGHDLLRHHWDTFVDAIVEHTTR